MKRDFIYIPIEEMSTKQYLEGVREGLWGGEVEEKYLKLTEGNPDNPLLENKNENMGNR